LGLAGAGVEDKKLSKWKFTGENQLEALEEEEVALSEGDWPERTDQILDI